MIILLGLLLLQPNPAVCMYDLEGTKILMPNDHGACAPTIIWTTDPRE